MGDGRTALPARDRWRVYLPLAAATFSQHVGLLFLFVTVPTTLRQGGASLTQVALFAFVFVPFALQFLWAPLVERTRRSTQNGWRPWFVATQLVLAAGFALLAAIPLEPATSLSLIGVAMLLALAAGTQKIAMGGLAIEKLHGPERAFGNAALGAGSALGSIAGTIGLVALYALQGWTVTLVCAALLTVVAGLSYSTIPRSEPDIGTAAAAVPSLRKLLRQSRTWRRLAWLLPIAIPIGLPFGLIQPRLADAGLDLLSIGLLNGFGQLGLWLLAAPVVTAAIQNLGEGPAQRATLAGAGLVLAIATGLTIIDPVWIASAVISSLAAIATLIAVSLVTYTRLMGEVEAEGQAATDFSLYLSLYGLFILIGAGTSGVLADWVGYAAVLGLSSTAFSITAYAIGRD